MFSAFPGFELGPRRQILDHTIAGFILRKCCLTEKFDLPSKQDSGKSLREEWAPRQCRTLPAKPLPPIIIKNIVEKARNIHAGREDGGKPTLKFKVLVYDTVER